MSSPQLSENPDQDPQEENNQGDTFIFSECKNQSKIDLDDDSQINNDSFGLGEVDDNYDEDVEEEDEEYIEGQLDEFDTFEEPVNQEEYFEEQALELYLYSLKKKAIMAIYQNYRDEQGKKQVLFALFQRLVVKNYFNMWNGVVKDTTIQEESHTDRQQDYLDQNECEGEQIQNSKREQKVFSNFNASQVPKKGGSPILVRDFTNSSSKSSQINSSHFESNENLQESLHINKEYEQLSSNRQLKNIQSTNFEKGLQNNSFRESERNLQDNEDSMLLSYLNVNQKSQVNEGVDKDKKDKKESYIGVLSENQFMDQDQFESLESNSSNYNSLMQVKQLYDNHNRNCKESSQVQQQTHSDNQQSYQQPDTDCLINFCEKRIKDSATSVEQKMQYFLSTGSNNQPQNAVLEKLEENLSSLNGYQKQEQTLLTEGRIFDEQSHHTDYLQEEKDSNELQVEQSVYDEKSMEVLSTKKENLHSSRNFQVLSNRSKKDVEYEKGRVIYSSLEQENEKSYRKDSTVKFNNNKDNNNLMSSKGNQEALISSKSKFGVGNDAKYQFELNSTDKQQILLNNSITQPTFQNCIEEEQQNYKDESNSNFMASSHQQYVEGSQRNSIQNNHSNYIDESNKNYIGEKYQGFSSTDRICLNNQQSSCYLSQSHQFQLNEEELRKNGQQQEEVIISARENYFTHRNNNDQRLSQIEAFSVSKNIELTPTQQYMILSCRGNNSDPNHHQSVSQLEEQQEQAEYDLAHEVAYHIFGKKLFRKLRLAYKTSRTLDRPQSSRCHLTQYSSNEQLRQQQEKIMMMRKCFERLREIKAANKKKKDIQSRLFKYYEFRYIRRPLQKWYENNKIFQAKNISLQIISNAIFKINASAAFKKITQYIQSKKKENTVNNLLKYYERQSSLARQKTNSNGGEKNTQNNKECLNNLERTNGGYHRVRKEEVSQNGKESYQFEFEHSDKENNINAGNVKISSQEAGRYSKIKENQRSSQRQSLGRKEIQYNVQQEEKLIQSYRQGGQCNLAREHSSLSISEQNNNDTSPSLKSSDPFTQFQAKSFKDMYLNQNYKTGSSSQHNYSSNQNGQKMSNLSNFQSIQSTALGHYISTEISDNDLNNYQAKLSIIEYQQQQHPQTSNSSQQLQEIYNLINDKSSMVFECSKKTLNNNNSSNSNNNCQPVSSNTARSSSSSSGQIVQNNTIRKSQNHLHPIETGKFDETSNKMHQIKQNANINNDNIEKNLCQQNATQIQTSQNCLQERMQKQSSHSNFNNFHLRSTSEISQNSIRGETALERINDQSYLLDNWRKDTTKAKREQRTEYNLNQYLTKEPISTTDIIQNGNFGHSSQDKNPLQEHELDLEQRERTSSRSYFNEQVQSKVPALKYDIAVANQVKQSQEINPSAISLSPIPRRSPNSTQTPAPQYIQNNQSNYSNNYQYYTSSQQSQTRENSDALSFTHSQIKNSLNVSSCQNNNQLRNDNQSYQGQLNNSEKQLSLPVHQNFNQNQNQQQFSSSSLSSREVGKIKRNSSSQNRSYIIDSATALDTSTHEQNTSKNRNLATDNNNYYKEALNHAPQVSIFRTRNKHSSSFSSENINTIGNLNCNNNENNSGLVSFINRNNSSSRLNQQLEQQAEMFNSRKLNQSRNQSSATGTARIAPITTVLNGSHQKVDSKNNLQNCQLTENNNESFYLNKNQQIINNSSSSTQISKPPLQLKQNKITEGHISSRQIEKLPNQKIEEFVQEKQNDHIIQSNQISNLDSNFLKSQPIKGMHSIKRDIPKNHKDSIQMANKSPSAINQNKKENSVYKLQISQENSNGLNLNQNQLTRGDSLITNENSQNPHNYNLLTNRIDQDSQNSSLIKSHRCASTSNVPTQNYENHIKNKQFSQSILEAASQISQTQQPLSKKKQDQINQLKQYQYFKQVQTQRQQQSNNNSFSLNNNNNNNNHNNNNSFSKNKNTRESHRNHDNSSRNVSFERKKKQELSNVGQNIQNILYFEAKIRSKRLARSQERTKNDSIELCSKLENLENYIQQINHELVKEKEKRSYLVQEKQYLEQQEISRIY